MSVHTWWQGERACSCGVDGDWEEHLREVTRPAPPATVADAVTQAIAGTVHVASEAAEATAAVLLALAELEPPLVQRDDLDPLGRGQG